MIASPTTSTGFLQRFWDEEDTGVWLDFQSRYGELIRGFVHRLGLQAADCDDAVQNVLVRLTKRLPKFRLDRMKGRFRGYLKRVATREAFRILRQKGGRVCVVEFKESVWCFEDNPEIEMLWEEEWRSYLIRESMKVIRAEFSEKHVAIFTAYVLEEEPAEAVARTFGVSSDNVYQIKSRILRRLQELIRELGAEEG